MLTANALPNNPIAKNKALAEFEKYRVKQDLTYQSDFDRLIEGAEKV